MARAFACETDTSVGGQTCEIVLLDSMTINGARFGSDRPRFRVGPRAIYSNHPFLRSSVHPFLRSSIHPFIRTSVFSSPLRPLLAHK